MKSIHKFKLKNQLDIKKYKKILAKSKTEPLIMGILNITPDSFYDGGEYMNTKNAINQKKPTKKLNN